MTRSIIDSSVLKMLFCDEGFILSSEVRRWPWRVSRKRFRRRFLLCVWRNYPDVCLEVKTTLTWHSIWLLGFILTKYQLGISLEHCHYTSVFCNKGIGNCPLDFYHITDDVHCTVYHICPTVRSNVCVLFSLKEWKVYICSQLSIIRGNGAEEGHG
jgi:hypothetical protein